MTQVLAKPICDIINLSKKLSTFPDKERKKEKMTFFQDKLKENSNNFKELWKTLKSLGMNSKK